jgi:predicted Zn finger-like uncharacterized protein
MIVECEHCHTKYNVDETKIPEAGVRVRCNKCQNVIHIKKPEPTPKPAEPEIKLEPTAKPEAPTPEVEPPPVPEVPTEAPKAEVEPPPVPEESKPEAAPTPPEVIPEQPTPEVEPSSIPEVPIQAPEAEVEVQPPEIPEAPKPPGPEIPTPPELELPPEVEKAVIEKVKPAPPLEEMSEDDKKWHERARRLAKALASDMVLYNKEKVEQGLKDGTLAQLLGPEIRRSWEYYCQQIPKHIVEKTEYFKEQLNKIVGKGKEIFK